MVRATMAMLISVEMIYIGLNVDAILEWGHQPVHDLLVRAPTIEPRFPCTNDVGWGYFQNVTFETSMCRSDLLQNLTCPGGVTNGVNRNNRLPTEYSSPGEVPECETRYLLKNLIPARI